MTLLSYCLFLLFLCAQSTIFVFCACEIHIAHHELSHNMPKYLLYSIALAESGRSIHDNRKVAWPWTINVEGKGYVFETKQEAIQATVKFQKTGKKSIDVGCMQINLKHHPKAFESLEQAFDPKKNVAYAAQFVNKLFEQSGTWEQAVAHYHSATPKFNIPYKEKVERIWKNLLDNNIQPQLTNLNLKHPVTAFPKKDDFAPQTIWPSVNFEKQPAHFEKKPALRSPVHKKETIPQGRFYSVNGFKPLGRQAKPLKQLTKKNKFFKRNEAKNFLRVTHKFIPLR